MFLRADKSAFWRGFALGLSSPYRLFGPRKSYLRSGPDPLVQSWLEVGQALRQSMQQEQLNEQTPGQAPKRAA